MAGENLAELISNPEITTSQLDTVDSFRWTYRNRTLSPSLQAGRIAPLINTRKKTHRLLGSTVKITWSVSTRTRHCFHSRNVPIIAHDSVATWYSCNGLTSHTVREELSASCGGARGYVAYATAALPKRCPCTTNPDSHSTAPRSTFVRKCFVMPRWARIWDVTHRVFPYRDQCAYREFRRGKVYLNFYFHDSFFSVLTKKKKQASCWKSDTGFFNSSDDTASIVVGDIEKLSSWCEGLFT